MKKPRLNDCMPPWAKRENHLAIAVTAAVGPALLSLATFYGDLNQALNMVCIWRDGAHRVFVPGLMMHDFVTLLGGLWFLVWIPLVTAGLLAWVNYHGFSQGSKALYLMGRLPDRWELPRRCLTVPLLILAAAAVLLAVVLPVCWLIYTHLVPDYAIPPDQWIKVRTGLPHILFPFL